jgi:hypothetical protein
MSPVPVGCALRRGRITCIHISSQKHALGSKRMGLGPGTTQWIGRWAQFWNGLCGGMYTYIYIYMYEIQMHAIKGATWAVLELSNYSNMKCFSVNCLFFSQSCTMPSDSVVCHSDDPMITWTVSCHADKDPCSCSQDAHHRVHWCMELAMYALARQHTARNSPQDAHHRGYCSMGFHTSPMFLSSTRKSFVFWR